MKLPSFVKLVEVGPRGGLRNEKTTVPAATRIARVHRLREAGLRESGVTGFVSPKRVPQMADNAQVMAGTRRKPGVLTPNRQGFEAAWPNQTDEIVVFGAAGEAFRQKDID